MERFRLDPSVAPPMPTAIRATTSQPASDGAREEDYADALTTFVTGSPVVTRILTSEPDDQVPGEVHVVAVVDHAPPDLAALMSLVDVEVETYTVPHRLTSDRQPWWAAVDHQYRTPTGQTGRVYVAFPVTAAAIDALANGCALGLTVDGGSDLTDTPCAVVPPLTEFWADLRDRWVAADAPPFVPVTG